MAASMTRASRLGIHSADPVTEEFEFLQCGIRKQQTHIISPGIRGTRSYISNQVVKAPYTVGGPLVVEARPDDLDLLLPWILGGTKAGTTIALAETVPARYVTVDKIARVATYAGCKINQAVFSATKGQNLRIELDVQGTTYTAGASGSFPNIASTLSELQPYTFAQGVLTLDSTPREFEDFRLTINNVLILDRFMNSGTRTELPESDRIVELSCSNPYTSSEIALDDLAIAGISGSLVFTNGNYSLTITLTNLKAPPSDPEVPERGPEILQRLDFRVYATETGGSITREVIFDNDSTG